MEGFSLDEYLIETSNMFHGSKWEFSNLCLEIRNRFAKEWEEEEGDLSRALQLQKNAIIGYANETSYFKEKITAIIDNLNGRGTIYPDWYDSLSDGIYHENWGLAGIAEWFGEAYKESSSAKIIGDRVYFMENGRMRKMPQAIAKERREQLIRAFLLLTPEERLDKEFHEIYLLDGTRITIFREKMTKQGQDVIVFRRYVVPIYSFEEQALHGTIPAEAIPLLEAMVDIGYNIAFTGAVRTAKTTFLSTWQSYEDPMLEGVMVETDPEIPLHQLMPCAPILQIIADNERLGRISKNLLRSDADYFILAEARDGNALDAAIRIASKGTRRMKITFHCRKPLEFPYDVAWEIMTAKGGDLDLIAKRVANSFDYIFHFIQRKDKSQKRLYGIYEILYNHANGSIEIKNICSYDTQREQWHWKDHIDHSKRIDGQEENPEAFQRFAKELKWLADRFPVPPKIEEGGGEDCTLKNWNC